MPQATQPTALTTILRDIPDNVFWGENYRPHYNRIFAEVMRVRFSREKLSSRVSLEDMFSERAPNLSSFQRATAKEAARRRKKPSKKTKKSPEPAKVEEPESKEAEKPTLEDAYQAIRKAAVKALAKYSPLQREMTAEDIAHGYFEYYLEKNWHDRFNPEKASLKTWVTGGIYRWCIDRLRDKRFQFTHPGTGETVYRTISADQEDASGNTLTSGLVDERDPLSQMIVEEALALVSDEPLIEEEVFSPLLGKCRLSPRVALEHKVAGFKNTEIQALFQVSKGCASQALKTARAEMAEIL